MRKNNDGYVLPFVMVVMAVLCLAATSLLTLALSNMKLQTRNTERTKEKYVAVGAIECAVSYVNPQFLTGAQDTVELTQGQNENCTAKAPNMENALRQMVAGICDKANANAQPQEEGDTCELEYELLQTDIYSTGGALDAVNDRFTCKFRLKSTYRTVQVTADLEVTGVLKNLYPYENSDLKDYCLKPTRLTYEAYKVAVTEEEAG